MVDTLYGNQKWHDDMDYEVASLIRGSVTTMIECDIDESRYFDIFKIVLKTWGYRVEFIESEFDKDDEPWLLDIKDGVFI